MPSFLSFLPLPPSTSPMISLPGTSRSPFCLLSSIFAFLPLQLSPFLFLPAPYPSQLHSLRPASFFLTSLHIPPLSFTVSLFPLPPPSLPHFSFSLSLYVSLHPLPPSPPLPPPFFYFSDSLFRLPQSFSLLNLSNSLQHLSISLILPLPLPFLSLCIHYPSTYFPLHLSILPVFFPLPPPSSVSHYASQSFSLLNLSISLQHLSISLILPLPLPFLSLCIHYPSTYFSLHLSILPVFFPLPPPSSVSHYASQSMSLLNLSISLRHLSISLILPLPLPFLSLFIHYPSTYFPLHLSILPVFFPLPPPSSVSHYASQSFSLLNLSISLRHLSNSLFHFSPSAFTIPLHLFLYLLSLSLSPFLTTRSTQRT